MRVLLPGLALILLSMPLGAQNLRPSQRIDNPGADPSFDPAVATHGEATVAAWRQGPLGSSFVYASASDGRGLAWGPPVRLDADPSHALKRIDPEWAAATEDGAYVVWMDSRHSALYPEAYLARSLDGGATWQGEQHVDKGYPIGQGGVTDMRLAVSPHPAGDRVHVLMAVDDGGATGFDRLMLASSSDGGGTFGPAAPVSSLGAFGPDVDGFDLAAQGDELYVAWQDDRHPSLLNDVWFRRSADGGATWLEPDRRLDSSGAGNGSAEGTMTLAVEGAKVVVGWQEALPVGSPRQLRVSISSDKGGSWPGDQQVGDYATGVDRVSDAQVAIAGGNALAAWTDNRTGPDEAYVAVLPGVGGAWIETPLSTLGAEALRFGRSTEPQAPETLILAWRSLSFRTVLEASYSRDSGQSWLPPLLLSDSPSAVITSFSVAVNRRYNNFIGAWLADDPGHPAVFAGGLRPQYVFAEDPPLTAGKWARFVVNDYPQSEVGHDFRVVFSGSEGSLVIPGDGRDLGLAPDLVFLRTVLRPELQSLLRNTGAGVTSGAFFPATIPPGTPLQFAAVTVLTGGGFGSITDLSVETVQ